MQQLLQQQQAFLFFNLFAPWQPSQQDDANLPGERVFVANDTAPSPSSAPTSATITSAPAVRECFDLTASEPRSLTGRLDYSIFPGPPNFEDVQTGDTPQPTYTLRLDENICISDGAEGFADPDERFDRVHLVVETEQAQSFKSLIGKRLTVDIDDRMAAHTGHHHAPLVAWVSNVKAPVQAAPTEDDPTAEYGTAATTIRAFYSALGSGQGGVAANFVVPEKRSSGPFAAGNLSRFYGNMRKPLVLLSLERTGQSEYAVRYRYAVTKSVCDGRATVTTTMRDGRNYIAGIKALDGC